MLKKISTAILAVAVMVAANATVFARMNGGETDKQPARSAPAKPAEQKN